MVSSCLALFGTVSVLDHLVDALDEIDEGKEKEEQQARLPDYVVDNRGQYSRKGLI